MPTKDLDIQTDENGHFGQTEVYNPLGWFDLTVELRATLLSPPETTVIGALDIDAADGSPGNPAKPFRASTGEKISLGSWRLDAGDNVIVVSGDTEPKRANTTLAIRLEA